MAESITNDKAWEYYKLAAAAAVPVLVASTVVGVALDTDNFIRGMIEVGYLTAAGAGCFAVVQLQNRVPMSKENTLEDREVWTVCGYHTLGSLLAGGLLFNLWPYIFAGRTALEIAHLNGAVAAGMLGVGFASVIAAGTHGG